MPAPRSEVTSRVFLHYAPRPVRPRPAPSVRILKNEQAMPTLYLYPGCSTCRSAQKWLKDHGVTVTVVDLVKNPPSPSTLADLEDRGGLPVAKFFNISGESYRSGGFKDRLPTMDDAQKREALAADGMLIKRPILDLGDRVLVGFRAADWEIVVQGRAGG